MMYTSTAEKSTSDTDLQEAPRAGWHRKILGMGPPEPPDQIQISEREMARTAGIGPYVALTLVLLLPAVVMGIYLWSDRAVPGIRSSALPYLTVFFLAELLASLLLVARWFQRLTTNSDIEELRKAAFSYRLGGAVALRPFLNHHGESLTVDSKLAEYRRGIIEPNFYKSATNPPFFLALVLVVSLGLFAFYAPTFGLLDLPTLLLLGPELHEWQWQPVDVASTGDKLQTFRAYGAGALVCVAFAFAGSLLWAVIYMTRRMSLRDVTAYTYQEVSMRLVASAILSLFVYHILAPAQPSPQMPWGEGLMVAAFGVGVMPETVLRWLGNKASRLFGASEETDRANLEYVLGINAFMRTRLAEVGIYDAQGLVANNPLRLALQTPYSLPQILDWIGQAFILLQFGPERLQELRKLGICTLWELDAANSAHVAAGATPELITAQALAALRSKPSFIRASEIQQRLLLEN